MQDDTQTRLLDRQISRRTMLQVSAVAGASAFLVACGGGSSASEGASPSSGGGASPSGGTSPTDARDTRRGDRRPVELGQLAGLHGLERGQHRGADTDGLPDQDRRRGQLRRGHRQQRRLPGHHPAPARCRPRHGLGPDGHDRLHGRPPDRRASGSSRSTRPRSRRRSPTWSSGCRAPTGIPIRPTTTRIRPSPTVSATTTSAPAWT